MAYHVKELYYTLQGEGLRAGRASVFCRFTGCNLWSGRPDDKRDIICTFCDTDFVGTDGPGGGVYRSAEGLAQAILRTWPPVERSGERSGVPYVVFTGGEPLLQLDEPLLDAVRKLGFESAVETNGTISAPRGLDWITVSPKSLAKLEQRTGNELKLLFPFQIHPDDVASLSFDAYLLSPITSEHPARTAEHTRMALEYCLNHPQWRLSAQLHKHWNIP